MIQAYVTNLGKYNEGELCGEYLKLPATREDVQALLSRIGIDGVLYEEVFITDYETDIDGLSRRLGEYESIDELNYLASLLSDMDKWEILKFEAVLECGEYTSSVKDLINLAQNLDCYDYLPEIRELDELGQYYTHELGCIEIPEALEGYIDYEAIGRDVSNDLGGSFTGRGYVMNNCSNFRENYSGRGDLLDEHKIFAYPDRTGKESAKLQLERYGKMAASRPLVAKSEPTHAER